MIKMNPDEVATTMDHIKKCDYCQNLNACFMELCKLHYEERFTKYE